MKQFTLCTLLILFVLTVQSQNQNPTQNVCAGVTETYNVSSSLTGSTFAWTISPASGGTIIGSGSNISITWGTTPGTYVVQVVETSANGCVGDPQTVAVTVIAPPTANAGSNTNLCAQVGMIINLSGSVTNAASQSWTTSGTSSSFTATTTLTPTYTLTAADLTAGSVSFTLTAFGNAPCNNASSTVTYTISPAPVLIVGNNGPVCQGSTLGLTANISGATYSWTGPNTYTSSNQNPTVSNAALPAMSGTYSVTVSNIPGGCPNLTASTNVVVNPKPATSGIWHN